jgi:hypothetical protein
MKRKAAPLELSSVERYREMIWTLVTEANKGPDYERFADPKLAFGDYRTRLDLLNAISKAAVADKQLEDLAAIHRKLREAEETIAEMLRATADERHHRAARVEAGCAAGDGSAGTSVH